MTSLEEGWGTELCLHRIDLGQGVPCARVSYCCVETSHGPRDRESCWSKTIFPAYELSYSEVWGSFDLIVLQVSVREMLCCTVQIPVIAYGGGGGGGGSVTPLRICIGFNWL